MSHAETLSAHWPLHVAVKSCSVLGEDTSPGKHPYRWMQGSSWKPRVAQRGDGQ